MIDVPTSEILEDIEATLREIEAYELIERGHRMMAGFPSTKGGERQRHHLQARHAAIGIEERRAFVEKLRGILRERERNTE